MFGSGSSPSASKPDTDLKVDSPASSPDSSPDNADLTAKSPDSHSGQLSPSGRSDNGGSSDKKRRSGGMGSKASSLLASAKNSLNFSQSRSGPDLSAQSPIQKLGKQDPALAVPQGQHNNSAGESLPGPKSTFRVGVWEDRNRKCRRTMEDTHAFLYNFLDTPLPAIDVGKDQQGQGAEDTRARGMVESDNGYFAIFDGHAGTFAADWCGKKLHIILEETVRKHPNVPIPEILDQTFTAVDAQLEKLPLKNSGCTAAIAVLRWEDRVSSDRSATGSQALGPATAAASKALKSSDANHAEAEPEATSSAAEATPAVTPEDAHAQLKGAASRQRVLYTANVGDARIVLCRNGKALRLSYDHKGSDENEGKRIANAGGLILNNRVNGVLAVTRALGDAYIKDLVTGHPYTTETVIQADQDEFMIIACDGLWDVCSDQEAVDLVRNVQDPNAASKALVDHALNRFSTDNLSCMIVRFDREAIAQTQQNKDIGVETEHTAAVKLSEADKIVSDTKQKIADGSAQAVGVSASNGGKGHDPTPLEERSDPVQNMKGNSIAEEEPSNTEHHAKAAPAPNAETGAADAADE